MLGTTCQIALLSGTALPQGDMISVQPVFSPFSRITPAGQAKA
jgi:hypothetical protein